MDAADRDLFERSVRAAIERRAGAALDAALDDIGWREALDDDAPTAVSILFGRQGWANTTSSALHWVLGSPVLPRPGAWRPPAEVDGDRVRVRGLATAWALDGVATVPVVTARGDKDALVDVPVADLRVRAIAGLDPSLALVEVTGDVPLAAGAGAVAAPVEWDAAVSLGRLALAHELTGASRRMLELAREHALERVQFGKPIAAFQAVRHRLAETLIAIETAEAALDAAWLDRAPFSGAMAKALAGRGARTAARHCQQVLAGIGFTTEHPFHRYVRRVLVLDELLGSARALTASLGDDLLATRRLPPLLPL
jgi:alkylation response protein AidB-like acyl-CoA dehydrogenase